MMGKLQTKTEESRVQFIMKGKCKYDDEQKAQGMLNYKDFSFMNVFIFRPLYR